MKDSIEELKNITDHRVFKVKIEMIYYVRTAYNGISDTPKEILELIDRCKLIADEYDNVEFISDSFHIMKHAALGNSKHI